MKDEGRKRTGLGEREKRVGENIPRFLVRTLTLVGRGGGRVTETPNPDKRVVREVGRKWAFPPKFLTRCALSGPLYEVYLQCSSGSKLSNSREKGYIAEKGEGSGEVLKKS